MKKESNIDYTLTIASLGVVVFIVGYLTFFPEQGNKVAGMLFSVLTDLTGTAFLWFGFLSFFGLALLGFSKYGNIKLGLEKTEFSTYSYVAMMICAGLGSATVYWAFVEWAYYFMKPPFGMEPYTSKAAEWATAYNFFHWGLTAWALYCIASLPIAYSFYVRKREGLKLSAVCSNVIGEKAANGVPGKIIDIIFIFSAIGGLGITLGLSIPMISTGIAKVIGIGTSFTLNVLVVIAISIIFSLSSYIGIEKGMRKLSDANTYLAIGFAIFVLVVGPTIFILKETTNGIGIMLQNYIHMSLYTDPIDNGGFPEGWTIFYWAYWLTYTPFMGLFVTKISRGRKIKEVIWSMILGGSAGCWFFFGILGSFSMNAQLSGQVQVSEVLSNVSGSEAIMQILATLPLGNISVAFFTLISILFLATSLDSASFTLAATASKKLDKYNNPSSLLKLFWCLVLALVPLAMMFIDAPLKTVQTSAIVTSIPLLVVLCIMIFGWYRDITEDYGNKSDMEILEESRNIV